MKNEKMLCGGLVVALLLASSTALAVGYDYSAENRTLVVTVPSAETALLENADAAMLAHLTGNDATNFVKRGEGRLSADIDLSAYLGDITIEAGVYSFVTNTALGRLGAESVCGSVYVKDGATLDASNKVANAWTWWNKRICFEGRGTPEMGGALTYSGKAISRMVFSSNIVMTANATICSRAASFSMSGGSTPLWLDMNGHTLTMCSPRSGCMFAWGCLSVKNPGHIIVDGVDISIQNSSTRLGGDASNTLSFTNNATLCFNLTSGRDENGPGTRWTLDARCLGSYTTNNSASEKNTTNINYWAGPVLLGEKTFRGYLTRGPLTFMGPVSGSGGLYLSGDPAASDSGNINFHLMNPENTFTGPLGLYRVAAHLWNDGALPAGGAGAVVTNGAIVLENRDATYTLPQATFVGVGTQGYGRVAKGRGTWASVTKKGTGELDWQSASGSDLLDVQSGSVTITGSIRQELAGIIESYRTYYADNTTMNRFWDNVFTNGVTHSPDAYYNESHHLWTDSIPDSSKPRYMIAYTGYIWNNEPTNVTWSFAGMAGVHFEVRLDGERVFKFFGEGNASTTVSNTVAGVTPGSHLIDLRGYYMSAAKNTFPIGNPRCGLNWPSHDFAVGFDKLGRASPNQSDYAKLIDPGDGSLLTWARPEDIVPGETVSPEGRVVPNTVPVFKKMRFAAGTGVSFALRSYALAELEGLPAVTGAAEGLSITSRWTVAAADIAAGRKLTAEGPLAFGEGAVLEIDGEVRGLSATFTIAEATGGITGHPTLSPTTSTAWHLRRDGNSLKLDWTKGMMLIFR